MRKNLQIMFIQRKCRIILKFGTVFSFTIFTEIINDFEPKTIDEGMIGLKRKSIQVAWTSLARCEVFVLVVQIFEDVKPIGYNWVLLRKHN